LSDATAKYVDDEGQTWYACAFWKPRVLSRRAEVPAEDAEEATIVFERPGEERVATTTSLNDWDTPDKLRELFLCAADRRKGGDRRTGHDRRQDDIPPGTNQRSGTDRRCGVGRRLSDRLVGATGEHKLRETPATYSREEAAQIRAMAIVGSRPICPRCGEDLEVGSRISRGEDAIRQLSCPKCFRAVMVRGMG
jgi:hypothetical protein